MRVAASSLVVVRSVEVVGGGEGEDGAGTEIVDGMLGERELSTSAMMVVKFSKMIHNT